MKYLLVILFLVIIISGCVQVEVKPEDNTTNQSQTICEKPRIQIGNECCLDLNDDNVCDISLQPEIDKGDFYVYYEQNVTDSVNKEWAQYLQKEQLFNPVTDWLNTVYNLPYNVPIIFNECRTENAYYDRETKSIYMCYEFLSKILNSFEVNGYSEEESGILFGNAAHFILFHELGHALVDIYDIPVTGSEEDAVDEFATALALESGKPDISISGALLWGNLAQESIGQEIPTKFISEHSINAQRFTAIMCRVYGSNTTKYSNFVDDGLLEPEIVPTCEYEYNQMKNAWTRLLEDYLKY